MVRITTTISPTNRRLLDAISRYRRANGMDRPNRADILEEAFEGWMRDHQKELRAVRSAAAAEGEILGGLWRRSMSSLNKWKLEPKCSAHAT